MTGILSRIFNFAVEQDEAVNVLGGGLRGETISGTVGRGLQAGKWWAAACRALIEVQPWFGPGHCLKAASDEADRRVALKIET